MERFPLVEDSLGAAISAAPNRIQTVRSGWNYPEYLTALVTAIDSGANDYISDAVTLGFIMATSRDMDIGLVNALGESGPTYSTKAYSDGKRYWLPNEVGVFNFAGSILDVCIRAEKLGHSYPKIMADNALECLDSMWWLFDDGFKWDTRTYPYKPASRRYDNSGRYDRRRLPQNMQAIAAGAYLKASVIRYLRGESHYADRRRWKQVHDYVMSNISEKDGQLFWTYWSDSRPDDWGHGASVAQYLCQAYHYEYAIDENTLSLLRAILDKHHNDDAELKYTGTRIDGSKPWTDKNLKFYNRFLGAFKRWGSGLALLGEDRTFMRNAVLENVGLTGLDSLNYYSISAQG